MLKRKIRLIFWIILVVVSALFAMYCIINSDKRLYLSIISVIGTGALLIQEIYKKTN